MVLGCAVVLSTLLGLSSSTSAAGTALAQPTAIQAGANTVDVSFTGDAIASLYTVTAYDAAGNTGVATLTVTYVVPPVIRITGFTIASNATAQLSVTGPAGGVLGVQTSTNLAQWYTIGTVTNAAGSLQFSFPFSPGESKRFFRLVQE